MKISAYPVFLPSSNSITTSHSVIPNSWKKFAMSAFVTPQAKPLIFAILFLFSSVMKLKSLSVFVLRCLISRLESISILTLIQNSCILHTCTVWAQSICDQCFILVSPPLLVLPKLLSETSKLLSQSFCHLNSYQI